MYRAATRELDDPAATPAVEDYAAKTISDGLTTDTSGRIYVSDPEHSAIVAIEPDRRLVTLAKDARLRWPDGFSFGPDGWLYVTCSALHHVLFVSASTRESHAPYQIYRLRPGAEASPGQ
jgi:sugar lactone lactonase YvrE